mmetsp:Transcript_2160/g.6416  ORF Transcript_2160/g.6416 Transcript_2160/m.6416 type:complete len:299 (-) Transcript_2160:140-1036(-)
MGAIIGDGGLPRAGSDSGGARQLPQGHSCPHRHQPERGLHVHLQRRVQAAVVGVRRRHGAAVQAAGAGRAGAVQGHGGAAAEPEHGREGAAVRVLDRLLVPLRVAAPGGVDRAGRHSDVCLSLQPHSLLRTGLRAHAARDLPDQDVPCFRAPCRLRQQRRVELHGARAGHGELGAGLLVGLRACRQPERGAVAAGAVADVHGVRASGAAPGDAAGAGGARGLDGVRLLGRHGVHEVVMAIAAGGGAGGQQSLGVVHRLRAVGMSAARPSRQWSRRERSDWRVASRWEQLERPLRCSRC